ncbi:MAG: hypothetical protein ACQEXJ_10000 [Myxococcota bacterium]
MTKAEPNLDLGPVQADEGPSPVEGLTRAEYDAIADDIRWFSRLTLGQKLRSAEHYLREDRWLRRFHEVERAS